MNLNLINTKTILSTVLIFIEKDSEMQDEDEFMESRDEHEEHEEHDDSHGHPTPLNLESFMKRRKKKLVSKGKTISVPKKPLTAYAIFVKKMRKDYQDAIKRGEMEEGQMAELMKDMGKKWSNLPQEEKDLFTEAANHDKKRYEAEMQEFNIQGGKGKSIQDFDASRPKKCLSAYMIFVRETRPIIVREQRELANDEDSKCKLLTF